MADEQQTPTATGTSTPAAPATFRAVPTVALVAVGFLALCLSPIAFQGGPWFLLFLAPAAVAVWVVRSRTRVDEAGLHVRRIVGTRSVAWSDLTGLRLPGKGWVRAVPAQGAEVELRGIRIRDLGRVAEASGHRISAPTPAEAEAAAEHARELEAARMRVAKLRERQSAAGDDPEQTGNPEQTGDTGAAEDAGTAENSEDTASTDDSGATRDTGAVDDTGTAEAPGTSADTARNASQHTAADTVQHEDTTAGTQHREG
ncbi:PH domain-containing protein [Actinomycetospora chiangmaiensis]|uniref:PH domain-containing protein n=1 Tax=Actinomycetospora chiangmaiensis TaxID=402650 RepID=UPI000371B965|nr:PH domain-containing protein [Actinomycetospora chiangmaiensis]